MRPDERRTKAPGDSLLIGSNQPLPILPATPGAPPPGMVVDLNAPTITNGGPGVSVPAGARNVRLIKRRYEVLGELGAGGMGAVYKALDRELVRTVAIKVIHPDRRGGHRDLRFLHEAQSMAKIEHPGSVAIHDMGVDEDGSPFFVMEYVEGKPLDTVIAEGLTPARAAMLLHQVAGALQRAHELGIVHRDVKPSNVLVTGAGTAKLTDFGIAKDEQVETLTARGAIIGTLAYMPPEQTGREERPDGRADVYSLGATLYHCLVGRPPFMGTREQVLAALLEKDPVPPRKLNADVPADLDAIALRCLEKEPADRYQTAAELQAELGRYLAGEPILGRQLSLVERTWRWVRKRRKAVGLVAGLMVVAASAAGGTWGVYAARARAGAKGELERGDRLFEAKEYEKAEEAYASAARFETPYAAEAREKVLRAKAWGLAAEAERLFQDYEATRTRIESDKRICGRGTPWDPAPFDESPARREWFQARLRVLRDSHRVDGLLRAFALTANKLALLPTSDEKPLSNTMLMCVTICRDTFEQDQQQAQEFAALANRLDPKRKASGPLLVPTIAVSSGNGVAGTAYLYKMEFDDALGIERPYPYILSKQCPDTLKPYSPGKTVAGWGGDSNCLGITPVSSTTITAGFYLVCVELEGFFPAIHTLVVRPGSSVSVSVNLYPSTMLHELKDEFVFVPKGRSRWGEWFCFEEVSDDILMCRHEVTNLEWLNYIRVAGQRAEVPVWGSANEVLEHMARNTSAPVRGISPRAASLYVEWLRPYFSFLPQGWGLQLPSRSDYYRSLRGDLPFTVPWGHLVEGTFFSGSDFDNPNLPVMSFARDMSVFGVFDLGGSVTEVTGNFSPDQAMVEVVGADYRSSSDLLVAMTTGINQRRASSFEPNTTLGFRLAIRRVMDRH